MSDTVKLIIEIPKSDYKAICANKEDAIIAHDTCRRIANNGIPLDENKGDVIRRDSILTRVRLNYTNHQTVERHEIEDIIKSEPSAENKGEWIESKERSKHWYCSVCGGIHTDPETGKWRETFDYRYPFCPNCGADMRGKAK